MPRITKNLFLNTLFCPTFGWRLANGKIREELTQADRFRMEEGKEIGRRARELFPEGNFIRETDHLAAAKSTTETLQKPSCSAVFEGAFLFGNYIARADILLRNGGRNSDLIEVKSSVNARAEFIDDMAYTTLVARESGFSPAAVKLMLVDKNYRLGMESRNLFQTIDCTEQVLARVEEFASLVTEVTRMLTQPTEPEPCFSYKCKKCSQFQECTGRDLDYPIFLIPRLPQKKADELIENGILCVRDVPDEFPLSDNQKKVVECVKCGRAHIDPAINKRLQEIRWPACYLDFETTTTVIPLHPGMAPYEKIPTQYSIHFCERCGCIHTHREFIADPRQDCRRELAERLIEDLAGDGSIITYGSFEKTVIGALAGTSPDLAGYLRQISARIVDLEKFVHYLNHPEFRGQTSIKVVLPVMVPELSYDGLEIANGDEALVTFAMMARGMMDDHEWEQKRAALLEYCKLDTLAMVRLHEALERMGNS